MSRLQRQRGKVTRTLLGSSWGSWYKLMNPERIQNTSGMNLEQTQNESRIHLERIWNTSGTNPERLRNYSGMNPEHVWNASGTNPEHIWNESETHPKHIWNKTQNKPRTNYLALRSEGQVFLICTFVSHVKGKMGLFVASWKSLSSPFV